MSMEEQEIKDIVDQITATGFLVILQLLEIRLSLIIHNDDFAVQNCLKSEFLQRLGNREELLIEGDLVTGIKGNLAVLDFGNGPVSVPFHLEEPFRMIKRFS